LPGSKKAKLGHADLKMAKSLKMKQRPNFLFKIGKITRFKVRVSSNIASFGCFSKNWP
jgi:hypothetical protein